MRKEQVLRKLAAGEIGVEEAKRLLNKPKAKTGTARDAEYAALYAKAHEAGMAAGNAHKPTPMIVGSPSTPLGNDVDPTQKTWYVESGVCGFAWIKIGDARSSFARWLRRTGKVREASYGGGYSIWVHEFGQSMERKERYARAFAEVLREGGIERVYAQSRMD
jgi:hypothetical protein